MEPVAARRLSAAALLVLLAVAAALAWRAARRAAYPGGPGDARLTAPPSNRARVEVLNASGVRGLARRATFFLRDAGFDVVRYANDTGRRARTLVLDRSGRPELARRVAKALGSSLVESRPDSTPFLDVTVLLGADWHPPPKPFYP